MRSPRFARLAGLTAAFWLASGLALATEPGPAGPSASVQAGPSFEVSPERFERAAREHILDVGELRLIRQEAEAMGVRAWLFGGTASAYGHYLRWDLERKSGAPSGQAFQADRFDYDYTNIFRANQDLDIVIDGTPEQAEKLQSLLEKRFPYFLGTKKEKGAWEVRLLKDKRGDKAALLDNPDFLNQHSDSNSTGMVEITRPPKGDKALRDLRDWNAADSNFARDLREGRITYYFSKLHQETERFRRGMNPPILSAIRYLTKVVQYELQPRPEDLEAVRKIIEDFKPGEAPGSYVSGWIEKNGTKLFTNAVNIEYAWNLIDGLGLRAKLMKLKGSSREKGSLAWWMNKEPLRSQPVGESRGAKASTLGIGTITHDTRSFENYELIVMSKKGEPNFLISRDGFPDEAAVHGDGLYSFKGEKSSWGAGFNIRMRLDPEAREGRDFLYVKSNDIVVVLNKNAVRVVPESLSVTPPQWFEMLKDGFAFKEGDNGIYEKLKRRIDYRGNSLSAEEEAQIAALVRKELDSKKPNENVLEAFAALSHPLKDFPLSSLDQAKIALAGSGLKGGDAAGVWKELNRLVDLGPKAAAASIHETFVNEPSADLIKAWALLWPSNRYASPGDWLVLLQDANRLRGGWGIQDFLEKQLVPAIAALPAEKKKALAEQARKVFLALKEPNELLTDLWTEMDQRGNLWSASDWVELLARGKMLKDGETRMMGRGGPQVDRLEKLIRGLDDPGQEQLVQKVSALLSHPKVNDYFPYLWVRTPLAGRDPGSLTRYFKRAPKIDLYSLASSGHPIEGLFESLIRNFKRAQLTEFENALYSRGDFGSHVPFADEKRQFMIPLLKRRYELGQRGKEAENYSGHFREPWTEGWNSTLRGLIDVMADNRDAEALRELVYYLGIYDEKVVNTFEPEVIHLIARAGELARKGVRGAREVLRQAAENLFANGDSSGRDFGSALSALIDEAVRTKDARTLEVLGQYGFVKPVAAGWSEQLEKFLTAAAELRSDEALTSLARHYQVESSEAAAALLPRLIAIAREKGSADLLDGVAHNLSDHALPAPVILELVATAREMKAREVFRTLSSSWYLGNSIGDRKAPVTALREVMDAAFQMRDFETLHNLSFWVFSNASSEALRRYHAAYPEFVVRVLKLGAATGKADQALYRKLMDRESTPMRYPDKRAQNLWQLLTSKNPKKALAQVVRLYPKADPSPADPCGNFRKLARTAVARR